ncbi:hypothetical protein B0H19DRAFT_1250700 [Mycena capillaripes]|nr:hypothetical protein B0H19DRAFT_1250700 [Mycena capillaripes]
MRHEGPSFEAALASMTCVRDLHILCPVDPQALVDHFRAPLRSFTYGFPMCDTLYQFLGQQPTITSLALRQPLGSRTPEPSFLPCLERVEALVEDLGDLIVGAPVRELKFRYRPEEKATHPFLPATFFNLSAVHLTRVELMACQLVDESELNLYLPSLETLVILQDSTWGGRRASEAYPQLITDLARQLTRLRNLRLLIVITELGVRQANSFCQALRHHCRASLLHQFVFHGSTTCYHWVDITVQDSDTVICPLSDCTKHYVADLN